MAPKPLDRCLACGGDKLEQYFDVGAQPLANAFHLGTKELPRYPLGLNRCLDCWHSQNVVAVDPAELFSEYLYASGTTKTLARYFDDFVKRVEADFGVERQVPRRRLRILEIGCNDGSLLKRFAERGHGAIGVDPARNLSVDRNVQVICEMWGKAVADFFLGEFQTVMRLGNERAPFDAIIAMNVLGHVSNPLDFLVQAKRVLAPGGRIYIQTSQARMVERGEFDTVYHEHHSFFTMRSFRALAARAGLGIEVSDIVPIHGGSYLLTLVDAVSIDRDHAILCGRQPLDDIETAAGVYGAETYAAFHLRADRTRYTVREIVQERRSVGCRVIGYGAAAKAVTLMNVVGIGPDFIIDDAPLKIGKMTPGLDIPVYGSDAIPTDDTPILWWILAWNFRSEIVNRIKSVRPFSKDEFFVCFPKIDIST